MSDDGAILRDQVLAVTGLERAIEEALDQQSDVTLPHSELHASLRAVRAQTGAQRRDLEAYLRERGADAAVPLSPILPPAGRGLLVRAADTRAVGRLRGASAMMATTASCQPASTRCRWS